MSRGSSATVRRVALLVVVATLAACSPTGEEPVPEARTGPEAAAPSASPADAAAPDAAAPDGAPDGAAGGATATPAAADGDDAPATRTRFAGRIDPLPPALAAEMRGTTWRPGCPVPLSELRLLRFNYWGFDGQVKRGPMVVNEAVAADVLSVFHRLFQARFPIKRLGLTREFKESRLETDPHTRRSVTASFNCRPVVTPAGAGDTFSQHSYGLAIDVNPLQNPFVREDGWVRNRFARPYVDRSRDEPGMIHDGDLIVRAFADVGWAWGGYWSGGKDYMHFSLVGR